jgi:hypothetical protein
MLHTPSYNMGLSAGTIANAAKLPRPNKLEEVPGLEAILDKSEKMGMFFPSSFVEGYLVAYDNPNWKFINSN